MEIPAEPHGIGVNRYTYFVTNSPGLPWVKLRDVKPVAINQARKIRCLFTGCLSSSVDGFSPYFGVEKDYLRAQIARITATTHISPAGYYLLTENEEENEEATFNIERQGKHIELLESRNN
jgi:radial spoke head protein 4A